MEPTAITTDELIRYLTGASTPDESARIGAALTASSELTRRADALRATLTDLGTLRDLRPEFEVGPARLARLIERTNARPAGWFGQAGQRLREVVATLLFDSAREPALGFRGSMTSRVLRLGCDDGEIDLRLEPDEASGLCRLSGEVRAPDGCTRGVAREVSSGQTQEFPVASDGYFEIELSPGRYALGFESGSRSIVVDALEVAGA